MTGKSRSKPKVCCNGRHAGHAQKPKADPGPWAGEGYCARSGGWGTGHTGIGRCRKHNGRPIVHGEYSQLGRYAALGNALGELIEQHAQDAEPLNMLRELAAARALFEREASKDESANTELLTKLLEATTRIVKRIEDIHAQDAISRPELFRLMGEMGRVVRHHVDEETGKKIRDGWLALRVRK
jgi:hypothetical protein